MGDPKIEDYPSESYDFTEVSFEPDLKKFGMQIIDKDTESLLVKRVYDLAGVTPNQVGVYLNGKKINHVRNFQNYIDLYFEKPVDNSEKVFRVYE